LRLIGHSRSEEKQLVDALESGCNTHPISKVEHHAVDALGLCLRCFLWCVECSSHRRARLSELLQDFASDRSTCACNQNHDVLSFQSISRDVGANQRDAGISTSPPMDVKCG